MLAVALAFVGAVALGVAPAHAAESDTIASLVNQARWSNGQAGLIHNPALDTVALNWANQMAQNGALTHNPNTGSQIPGGWSAWGENIAQGYSGAAAVHAGWMASAGHHANIVGDYTDLGVAFIAAAGTTWAVEVFAKYAGHVGPANPSATASAPVPAPVSVPVAAPAPAAPKPAPAPPAPATSAAPVHPASAAPSATPTATPEPKPAPTPARTPLAGAASQGPADAAGVQNTAYDSAHSAPPHWLSVLAAVLAVGLVAGAGSTTVVLLRRKTHA